MKIRVLIVDDSALIRSLMTEIVNAQPDMEAVGTAHNLSTARELISSLDPDVLTLDVETSKMAGVNFMEKLMRLRPMPVVMLSALTGSGLEARFRAREPGAADFIPKAVDNAQGMQEYAVSIADKIREAASSRVKERAAEAVDDPDAMLPSRSNRISPTEKLIVVGASTGGTEAIRDFLVRLPPDCPGILIAQHMPEMFTRSFADRLDKLCRITVKEAEDNERMLSGHAYVAPGHSHLLVARIGAGFATRLSQAPPVNRHRPSVDVLFRSAANCAGKAAVGVILTGMGKDGAAGMLEMKRAGSYNFAQDEASSVVFGMPREAIATGGVDEVLPIEDMARRVMAHLGPWPARISRPNG